MEAIDERKRLLARYEETILRRDRAQKEAENYYIAYISVFGDLITETFRMKIACIRKKKMIAYCQQQANRGQSVNEQALEEYLAREMQEYEEELATLIENVQTAKSGTPVSTRARKEIKEIYYRLAKLIHPDLHPELAEDETIQEAWRRIVLAYRHNDAEALAEEEQLVLAHLELLGIGESEISIENLEERIRRLDAEIAEIHATDPYQYRFLLDDREAVKEKKKELREEYQVYEEYAAELDRVLSGFQRERVYS
ncbi:MAG: J domain-containing protein [Firmicutes bacterium]|nr:J domain-containing protein [Bacillota bacterium]